MRRGQVLKSKFLRVGSVVLVLLLFWAGVTFYNRDKNKIPPEKSVFPQTLQGLNLSQVVSGPQAIQIIDKLHGTGIKIKQGYIAEYTGPNGQIMIWVSESGSIGEARQLFDIMDLKIKQAAEQNNPSAGGPPFNNRRTFSQSGVSIVAVKGMGMENYYYQIGPKVYWIAAGGVNPPETLKAVIKVL